MKQFTLPLVLAAGFLSLLIGSAALNKPENAVALRSLVSGAPETRRIP